MIIMNKHDEEVLKSLKYVKKGRCPNIFISGKSLSSLERLGLNVISTLEEQEVLEFRGSCKHFTIVVPYFDTEKEAIHFMNHLYNSISIARDCYDLYRGFILIEFAIEWSKEGVNEALNVFWGYLRNHSNICFVLLFPEVEKPNTADVFFSELFSCGYCIRIKNELVTVHQSVAIFYANAYEMGYSLTDEAKEYLYQRINERNESLMENTAVMHRLLDQIVFDKEFVCSKTKTIGKDDISKYLPEKKMVAKPPIGFARL